MVMNWQGKTLGRYRLLHLLGRGGMGEVWLADDTQLRRQVAVKLLPVVMASDNNYLQDFKYEARAIAGLEHPHILPVHDFGEQVVANDVTTYLVMPYITGGSLRNRIHSITGPLPIDETLSTLKQAAEAIDYAHSQHVLHRDIKPGNMLLQDEWLLLADFGLAKLLSSSTYRSHTHAGAGTPEYMAPEQAMGKAEAASDRYSLAVIAYQVFTGHLPFRGETPYDTLIKQMREMPPAPRQFNANIPQAVEETLLQGLAKRPEERPASCIAFVNALERSWKIGQLPHTDPEATMLAPWNKRFQEGVQRHQERPIPSAPLLVPFPSENVGQGTVVEMAPKSPSEAGTQMYMSTVASVPSLPNTVPGEQLKVPVTPPPERREGLVGRRTVLIGGATVATAIAVAGGFALPGLLRHSSPIAKKTPLVPGPRHLIPGVPVLNLTGHTDQVWNAVWDPTGRYLATAGQDTHLMLWDIGSALSKNTTGFQPISTPIKNWKFSGNIYSNSICWSADGLSLVVTYIGTDNNNKVFLINPFSKNTTPVTYTDTNETDTYNLPSYTQVAWTPKTPFFAATWYSLASFKPKINMWQAGNTKKPIASFEDKALANTYVQEIAWSVDGTMLAGNTNRFQVVVWETKTGKVKQVIQLPDRVKQKSVQTLRGTLAWSPVDPHVLLTSNIDVLQIWHASQNTLLYTLGTDDPDALTPPKNNTLGWVPNTLGAAWSPNGRYVVSGYGRSAKMYLWDLQNQKPKIKNGVHIQDAFIPASASTAAHNGIVIDDAWSPDGRYLASASADKTVLIWKMDAS